MFEPANTDTTRATTGADGGHERLDWRFLLHGPGMEPYGCLILLGGTTTMAEHLVATGVAHEVRSELPDNATVDAIVKLAGCAIPLARLAPAVQPGGCVYFEQRRKPDRTALLIPTRLVHQCKRLGLHVTGRYIVAPNFDQPRRYLPLDVPGVLRWYLATFYAGATPAGWGAAKLARLSIGLCRYWLWAVAPCVAITAVAARDGDSAAGNEPWRWLCPAGNGAIHPVLLTSGVSAASRTVILPFTRAGTPPSAVIKTTLPAFNADTELEQATLAKLRPLVGPDLAAALPLPHGVHRRGDLVFAVEAYMPGRPISISSAAWSYSGCRPIEDLWAATVWLQAFHTRTQLQREPWEAAAIERWIEQPLIDYAATFGVLPVEAHLFSMLRTRAALLQGAPFPIVWQHYDFAPWNVYRNANRLSVLDWESGGARRRAARNYGPALCNLLYFVTYWSFIVQRRYSVRTERDELAALFVPHQPSNRRRSAVHAALYFYMQRLKVDPRFIQILTIYLWVEQALFRFERHKRLGTPLKNPRAENPYIQYIGVFAAQAEDFFRFTLP